MKLSLIILFLSVLQVSANGNSQSTIKSNVQNESAATVPEAIAQEIISGTITDENGNPLPGANIQVEGTLIGTVTDLTGNYSIEIPGTGSTLVFSFIGYLSQSISVTNQSVIDIQLTPDIIRLDEVVVVGYGTQRRSDITGTVASIPKERLDMLPNLNIAQAIQGSIPGVMIQTSSAGAAPTEAILIRGRNSILAKNDPLIVVDGIPYGGELGDINPNDVQSIEILKDASAAAIYGSRGANGVILITSKQGKTGAPTINYDGKFSLMNYTNVPDVMTGPEWYDFKMERGASWMTQTEQEVYDAGEWVNWFDLTTRQGISQDHNLSVSGGMNNTTYYISLGLLDVQGIQVNDDFLRFSNRINIDTKITDWLTLGTRTQLSYDDKDGACPESGPTRMNPLSRPYDENGNLTIYPWEEQIYYPNPLEEILWEDKDKSYQAITNNYAIVDFPFVEGLRYRLNTGFRVRFHDEATYKPMTSTTGYQETGSASTDRTLWTNTVVENILSYNNEFGKHSIFGTALYSFERNERTNNGEDASNFPNDFLTWYASAQAVNSIPSYSYNQTILISQMLRMNYAYDSRYLLTLTGRRDGYSGFGAETKWGVFPSVALGWNLANEDFFPLKDLFNELKIRASMGLNGNQAVDAYETITRLASADWLSNQSPMVGYLPSTIGMDALGWESSRTLNVGLDVGMLQNRIRGDLNLYKTNTTDLLLNRTISPVHGITSITQNIGETENKGIELSLTSRNVVTPNFSWVMSGNLAAVKNEILSLYGFLDEEGNEVDDIDNKWFIGQPIRVNYNYVIDGVWQQDEADEADAWGSRPGFVKFRDVNGDTLLTAAEDKQIVGQLDPKFIWGLSNTFSYKNFKLNIFIHGVHGVTKDDEYMQDDVYNYIGRNTINKNRWTTENPTNDFYMNAQNAHLMAGVSAEDDNWFEDASFVRIKDVSLSYDFPVNWIGRIGLNRLRLYVTGRNLYTFTKWNGMDPELDDQRLTPLERHIVFGLNLGF
ncbi:SusC/RagA family TonB-linked outer membrane protein [Bacteroidota bacterium]